MSPKNTMAIRAQRSIAAPTDSRDVPFRGPQHQFMSQKNPQHQFMSQKNKCAIYSCFGYREPGRTAQLSTRVKPETVRLLRQLAARDGITMAEVIERALNLYASQ